MSSNCVFCLYTGVFNTLIDLLYPWFFFLMTRPESIRVVSSLMDTTDTRKTTRRRSETCSVCRAPIGEPWERADGETGDQPQTILMTPVRWHYRLCYPCQEQVFTFMSWCVDVGRNMTLSSTNSINHWWLALYRCQTNPQCHKRALKQTRGHKMELDAETPLVRALLKKLLNQAKEPRQM